MEVRHEDYESSAGYSPGALSGLCSASGWRPFGCATTSASRASSRTTPFTGTVGYPGGAHRALPRCAAEPGSGGEHLSAGSGGGATMAAKEWQPEGDGKSTRLNSSHLGISYAVFCLKKT